MQGLWDNYKRCNICVMGLSKREAIKGTEEIFETTMTENSPKLISETKPQIQEP